LKNPYATQPCNGALPYYIYEMMRTLFLLLLFDLCRIPESLAQYLSGAGNPWALGAYSRQHTDIFSFSANQAALVQAKPGAAVGVERRYLMKELATYRLLIAAGNFGLQGISRGFSDYRESRFGLAYARRLGDKAGLGIQFNYNSLQIAGYGSAKAVSAEVGLLLHLSDKLHTGIHLDNPGGSHFGNGNLNIPSIYTMGWGYDLSEKVLLTTEISKEETQPVDTKMGIQYIIIPTVRLRAVIQTVNTSWWFGAGFTRDSWRLDVYTGHQQQLGMSAGILLSHTFNKEQIADR
jgi:hypothetical protein